MEATQSYYTFETEGWETWDKNKLEKNTFGWLWLICQESIIILKSFRTKVLLI